MRIRPFLAYYLSGAFVYGAGLLFYNTNNYYSNFLDPATKSVLMQLYILYLIASPVLYFISKSEGHKPLLVLSAIKKIGHDFIAGKKIADITFSEKNALLFMLVKIFFVPLMINFLISNYHSFISSYQQILDLNFSLESLTYSAYPIILTTIFLIDTLFFSFGYVIEAGFLKNKVRSVEPTALGWAVALVCYPPFNVWFGNFVPWAPSESVNFSTTIITFVARSIIILLLLVYLWATLSLGAKCSNLTNRGVVTGGAYRLVRHPAYISKNVAWWIMAIPIMSFTVFASVAVWSFVYFLRAVTEERHLSLDSEYKAYCEKTKYRFIPFVY